jgi:hypothetical protein
MEANGATSSPSRDSRTVSATVTRWCSSGNPQKLHLRYSVQRSPHDLESRIDEMVECLHAPMNNLDWLLRIQSIILPRPPEGPLPTNADGRRDARHR